MNEPGQVAEQALLRHQRALRRPRGAGGKDQQGRVFSRRGDWFEGGGFTEDNVRLATSSIAIVEMKITGKASHAKLGVTVQEVNQLLKQFEQTQKMMKMMAKGGLQKMMRGLQGRIPGMR